MSTRVLRIVGGPDRAALLWAIAYPGEERVLFHVDEGVIDTEVIRNEQCTAAIYVFRGVVRSGAYQGCDCCVRFDLLSHSGEIAVAA